MIEYLLDTNICIEIIRGKNQAIIDHLLHIPVGKVAISSITLAELEYGVFRSQNPHKNREALIKFCTALAILPFDTNASQFYGSIRSYLEKQGTPIGPFDMLIAAHGLALGLIVVTNNTKEFQRVPGLQLENWHVQSKFPPH